MNSLMKFGSKIVRTSRCSSIGSIYYSGRVLSQSLRKFGGIGQKIGHSNPFNPFGSSKLSESFADNVQPILNLYDEVRDHLSNEDENMMQIVVIGDQSHGKSSLLSAISGVKLPSGDGTQTRVPLQIQLRQAKSAESECIEMSAGSLHRQHMKVEEIDKGISDFTRLLAGDKNKQIVNKPITLTICNRNVPDLTIIDLPGIIHNDETYPDMPEMVENMIMEYISNEEAIILNVVQCMNDSKTSKSLELSKKVDPTRKRTLLAVTKIDRIEGDESLIEKYNEYQSVYKFNNERIYFVGYLKDSDDSEDSSDSSDDYDYVSQLQSKMPEIKHALGIKPLVNAMSRLQIERICEILPSNLQSVNAKIDSKKHELEMLGKSYDEYHDSMSQIYSLIGQIFEQFQDSKEGRYVSDISGENISLRGAIKPMHNQFAKQVNLTVSDNEFLKLEFRSQMKQFIQFNSEFEGLSDPDRVHPGIATKFIKDKNNDIKNESIKLNELITKEVESYLNNVCTLMIQGFPILEEELKKHASDIVQELSNQCKGDIDEIFEKENCRPFTVDDIDSYMSNMQQYKGRMENVRPRMVIQAGNIDVLKSQDAVLFHLQLDAIKLNYDSAHYVYVSDKGFKISTHDQHRDQQGAQWIISDPQGKIIARQGNTEKYAHPTEVTEKQLWHEFVTEDGKLVLKQTENSKKYQVLSYDMSDQDYICARECLRLDAFWQIARQRLVHNICMSTWYYLIEKVYQSQPKLQQKVLVPSDGTKHLSGNKWLKHLLAGHDNRDEQRKKMQNDLSQLQQAQQKLQEIRKKIQKHQ